MARIWVVGNRFLAEEEFDKLLSRNTPRRGQYKYAYIKLLKSGDYEVGLLKEKSSDSRLVKQEEIPSEKRVPESLSWEERVFDTSSSKGLVAAEKYKDSLMEDYERVTVHPHGLNSVRVVGEGRR